MAVDTGHYPYKYDEAIEAGTPVEVADACRDVVNTQHAALEDPTLENTAATDAATAVAVQISAKYGAEGGLVVHGIVRDDNGSGN